MIELSPKIKFLIVGAAFFLAAIIVAVVVLVVGQKGNVVKAQSISFSRANEQFAVEETRELLINIYPSDTANKNIVFSSSNTKVVEIVSSNENKVVVHAKSIGTATINAQSKSNKKLIDSCNVEVSDNIAKSIETADSASVTVGNSTTIDVSLTPDNANYQKIKVLAYDETKINSPIVNAESDKATITIEAISSGTSQLVVGFCAERNGENEVLLSKQIEIICIPDLVNELSFEVKSNTIPVFSEREDRFLIGENDTYEFKFLYKTQTGNVGVADSVNYEYDENIFAISNNNENYVVVPIANGDWSQSYIVFEYEGIYKTLLFVNGNIEESLTEFEQNTPIIKNSIYNEVNSTYTLVEGNSYVIELSEKTKNLLKYGFAEISINGIDQKEFISFDSKGLVLSSTKATDGVEILQLRFKITYWNRTEFYSYGQINLKININEKGFE